MVGLVVGSYQGCSEALHVLAREVAEARARTEWRQMGARSEHEALGTVGRWGMQRVLKRVLALVLPVVGAPHPRPPACPP